MVFKLGAGSRKQISYNAVFTVFYTVNQIQSILFHGRKSNYSLRRKKKQNNRISIPTFFTRYDTPYNVITVTLSFIYLFLSTGCLIVLPIRLIATCSPSSQPAAKPCRSVTLLCAPNGKR